MELSQQQEWRVWILFGFMATLFAIIGVRLGYLQIVQHSYYEQVAESQRKRAAELAPHRGVIYLSEQQSRTDTEVFPVATNRRGWVAYAVPRDMEDPRHIADTLAPALLAFRNRQEDRTHTIIQQTGQQSLLPTSPTPSPGEGEEGNAEESAQTPLPSPTPTDEEKLVQLKDELFAKFNQKSDPYEPLLKPYEIIDDELKVFLDEQQLAGIVLQEQEVRTYPEETLAAHAIGYVGYQEEGRIGRYGVEGRFESELSGDLGFFSGEQDSQGQTIGITAPEFRPAQDGADIVLSIDRVVQSIIEDELKAGVERYGAERGSILVMDPRTGAVLGMATYPTFDPNYYYAIADARVQTNPVVSDLFEPGSILKPVVMAAAIEEEFVEPDTTFNDTGPVKVADYTINTFDGKHLGIQTMTQVLEQSNNVGMVWVGKQLGAETMYDYFRRFGLGEKTGIELDGETQNQLPTPNEWDVTTVATTSFGQGIALTPLQALNSINALANDGKLMQPYVVSEIRRPSSEGLSEPLERDITKPQEVRQVVSPQTADKLTAMMVSVIENGVAGLAKVPGYYLAGKTGTAQVPDERGQYSADKKIISFVGYGPIDTPRFSILIKLDNPAGLSFASGTAAPMFKNVSEKLLKYFQIPPDYEPGTQPRFQVPASTAASGTAT